MKRRAFIASVSAAFCCAALISSVHAAKPAPNPSTARSSTSAVNLGGQRHLFIDDMLVAQSKNVIYQVHPPEVRQPVMQKEHPWEELVGFSSVIDDGTELKLYYLNPLTPPNGFVCLATSKDGIHWEKPELGLYDFRGSKKNNILFDTMRGTAYYDEHAADPNHRYMWIWATDPQGTEGIVLDTSPDGLHFTRQTQVLPFSADGQPTVYWDRFIDKYVCHVRGWQLPRVRTVVRAVTDDPLKPWPHGPTTRPLYNGHKLPMISSQLPVILSSNENDPPETDLYQGQVTLYPNAYKVYLAFPTFYYHYTDVRGVTRSHLSPDGQPGNVGVGEVQLCVSRDGINWKRYTRQPYLKAGWYNRTYVGWPWVIQGMVFRDGRIFQYGRLRNGGHGNIQLAKGSEKQYEGFTLLEQQPDRFVAAEFEYTGGTLTTEPFTFEGTRLALNFDTSAMGEGRVAILNADGMAVPGFGIEACDVLNGDFFDKAVTWKGKSDVSLLQGKTIRLRFDMRGTKLYAFRFTPTPNRN